MNPDADIPRKYKLKEHYLRDFLKENFKNVELVFDKQVDGGCSKYRPDVRIECLTHTVIIECDENKHTGYTCENKRVMTLFQDLGQRPIVFLRFNPDGYNDNPSCFILSKKIGQLSLNKKEWKERTDVLKQKIDFYIGNQPVKEVTVEYLYYD